MSPWSPRWWHQKLMQTPMHSMDVYTLTMLTKFQNFYTRMTSLHSSYLHSSQKDSGHHWNFTAWLLDLSQLGIKGAVSRQILHLVFKFYCFQNMVSKFILFSFPTSCHFPPPIPFYSSLSYFPSFFLLGTNIDLHIRMAMTSTYSIEAQCHQAALRLATTDFLKLMKDKDEHNQEHYARYISEIKALLDPHVVKLSTRESKELHKQVLETVKDPDCKFLRPDESETEVQMRIFQSTLRDQLKNRSSPIFQKEHWLLRCKCTSKMRWSSWSRLTLLPLLPWKSWKRQCLQFLEVHSSCYCRLVYKP